MISIKTSCDGFITLCLRVSEKNLCHDEAFLLQMLCLLSRVVVVDCTAWLCLHSGAEKQIKSLPAAGGEDEGGGPGGR